MKKYKDKFGKEVKKGNKVILPARNDEEGTHIIDEQNGELVLVNKQGKVTCKLVDATDGVENLVIFKE